MKAVRTKEGQARNPLFSYSERRQARINGTPYDTPEMITLPIGDVIDHPDCWRLVVKGVALPHDEECSQKVLAYLGAPGRQAILDEIKLLQTAVKTSKLSPKDMKQLQAMERAYAVELGLVPTHVDLADAAAAAAKSHPDAGAAGNAAE